MSRPDRGRRGSPEVNPSGDPLSAARTICLQQLAARPRSRAELSSVLARRGVPNDAADAVLDRYVELGLVDDSAYASMLVRTQHAERGLSRRAIAMNLRRRGISDEDSEPALQAIDADREFATALRLAQKKLRSLRGLDSPTQTRRLYGFLARRGYASAVSAQVIHETLHNLDLDLDLDPDDGDGDGDLDDYARQL